MSWNKYIKASLRNWIFTCIAVAPLGVGVHAQVTGGEYAFEYLRLANSPHVSALGGISIADPDDDISLALQNPAMMRPAMHNELQLNYDDYYAGIAVMNLQYGYYVPKLNTSFFFGLQYINYGTVDNTDVLGNVNGTFTPVDYAATFGASRKYLDNWTYGADLKWAHSDLFQYRATAAMADVGINYHDTSSHWDFGATAKNMGVMVKDYTSGVSEPLPFDLQLGISKKFKHMPLRLFATLHHLYEWNIRYDNPADLTGTNALGQTDTINDNGSHFGDVLFRHFIFGGELSIGKHILLTVSYNDLERRELALTTDPGLTGFAFGIGLYLNKFQVHYARTYTDIAGAHNVLGLTMALNRLIGFGQGGDKIHWNGEYPDWQ